MQSAQRASLERHRDVVLGREIPLPGLPEAQSVAAIPLIVQNRLVGVLDLESERPGDFGPRSERLWQIVAGHLASTLSMLEADARESTPRREPALRSTAGSADAVAVDYYQADDSVFVGGRLRHEGRCRSDPVEDGV